ncbi:MAG TPA: zf-HC2 domain-containing protein, partial [Micromonosporaceae bacterium]|nr:zf-HC2 domain-containing protein [Micromonosporaceae bacterium]
MGCEQWRELLSAQLDGEEDRAERSTVDAHLAECADCVRWLDRAAAVTRLARTSLVAEPPPISDAVLAAVPRPRRNRLAPALRLTLGVVGAAQLLLGLAQVGTGAGGHAHADLGLSATPAHLWHESAAWNVAVGAGFLFIAIRRTRPTGVLPMLTAFVAMLVLLSVNDLIVGWVQPGRLITHGFVFVGYLLVVALSRPRFDGPGEPPTEEERDRPRWRARSDGE